MTLQPQNDFSIPEETVRVARAAYPKGHLYMKIRDAIGTIYQDQAFAHLFPHNGRPVEAPWRLALITIIQFIELRPVDRGKLLAAFTLGKAGLLVRKERNRVAQDLFFGQAKHPSRLQGLLPEVGRVIPKILPVAAVGHIVPVPVIPQQ